MKLPLFVGIVALVVVAGTLMYVSNFTAYLGNDPTTCNNCHVMDAAYEGWYHGGHQEWATCSDCHTPHDFIPKYLVKAQSGFRHVSAFLLNDIPIAIRAKEASKDVIQANCIRCHETTVMSVADGEPEAGRRCYDCHRSVAHGERGVSVLPYQDNQPYREVNK